MSDQEMRKCSSKHGCQKTKPITEFNFKSREKGTRVAMCKPCLAQFRLDCLSGKIKRNTPVKKSKSNTMYEPEYYGIHLKSLSTPWRARA